MLLASTTSTALQQPEELDRPTLVVVDSDDALIGIIAVDQQGNEDAAETERLRFLIASPC